MEPEMCVWNKNAPNYIFVLLLTYYLDNWWDHTECFPFSHPNLVFEHEGTLVTQLIELDIMFTCSVKSARA